MVHIYHTVHWTECTVDSFLLGSREQLRILLLACPDYDKGHKWRPAVNWIPPQRSKSSVIKAVMLNVLWSAPVVNVSLIKTISHVFLTWGTGAEGWLKLIKNEESDLWTLCSSQRARLGAMSPEPPRRSGQLLWRHWIIDRVRPNGFRCDTIASACKCVCVCKRQSKARQQKIGEAC